MTTEVNVCPHCGKPVSGPETGASSSPATPSAAAEIKEEREYDHRGILLPRRTRMGGIIVPR
ncbi:MAG TPA: hypothetical protein VN670_03295 [Acidobacteriaceae bacterium]|nr:hypothetical protein [Acidobacteriaceae bacterium]